MNASGKLCASPRSPVERRWCGPTALSAITGRGYSDMVREIEVVRGGKPFKNSAYMHELEKVLVNLGYKISKLRVMYGVKHKPTLSQVVSQRNAVEREQFMLALVTGHFVAVQGDEICDSSYSNGEPMKFAMLPTGKKWKRVQHYIQIERVPA